jgi:hypothetical protein
MCGLSRTLPAVPLSFACLLTALALLPHPALANGYAVYAPPLAWSSDSRWLAAAVGKAWLDEDILVQGELRLYDRYGRYVVLATGMVGSPSFTSDASLLAAVVDGDVRVYTLQGALMHGVAPPPSQQLTQRGDVLDVRALRNAPAGAVSFYVTAGERFYGCKVYTLSYPGAQLTLLVDAGPEASALYAADYPGSPYIRYMQQLAPGNLAYERLMLFDPAAGASRLAAKQQARLEDYHESNAVFLDAQTVLFQRGGWGDWNLYTLDLATGRELLETVAAESPSVSGSGRWLAFACRDYDVKKATEYDWEIPSVVKLRDRPARTERIVSAPGVEAGFPAISPDGSHVAWLERTGAGSAVILRNRQYLLP